MADDSKVKSFYDSVAEDYHLQYQRERMHDITAKYPNNYIRLQILINAFLAKGTRRIIDVGVGEGTPLSLLSRMGIEAWGFDISPNMVTKARANMKQHGLDPERVFVGDIEDPCTYAHACKGQSFDGLTAMGVMPHVQNEERVIANMRNMLTPGGSVFIEFRNELFSLFTFNRHTKDFLMNKLLRGVSDDLKASLEQELDARLRLDMPPQPETPDSYAAIPARFHNPFEVQEMFHRQGFKDIRLLWYHYHPTLPWLEAGDKAAFRREALRLEHDALNWRGMFLCSAFLVEAVKA
ncbi:MAG: methyltransferase domain-containing protein [Humidesulfovibrio sp.]|uniref:class I SAM-dependent methyltransferase n=1 Tax=Humidesulfovibrio sp. TaxID=2910988 RepID=UPI0027F904F7|nr:methyltransferase domain-containing protein [Humidesulfovibrio sp.]MDQ7834254.1 methyltransferase domain-containing protein [Humidesulfovibrio sp.]